MTPKKKPPKPKQLRVDLDREGQKHLVKCARIMLDDQDVMHPPSRPAVIRWALRKCAAEVREG